MISACPECAQCRPKPCRTALSPGQGHRQMVVPFARALIVDPACGGANEHEATSADAGLREGIGRRQLARRRRIKRPAVIAEAERQIAAADSRGGMNDVSAAVLESVPHHVRHNLLENQTRPVLRLGANLVVFEPCAQPVQTALQTREVVGHCDAPIIVWFAAITARGVHWPDLASVKRRRERGARDPWPDGAGTSRHAALLL